jgi:WD40 repeat protein/energy-coupling factor transporter ATP-binding protein EcfA2
MENLSSQNDALGSTTGPLAGRQRQVFDILSLFQSSQMVGLFGENGSGKTTLIKRGVLPELEKGFLGIAGRKWKSITIRPGITPLENLSAGIAQLGLNQGKQKLEDEVFLTEAMRLSSEGLKNACLPKASQKSDFNALLVIDNFEDLFQFREVSQNTGEWDETVKCFIQNITKCASYSSIPVYFLIVLRAEYMSRLFEYRHFYEIVSASQYNLPQFRKTEFTEVIKAILQPSKITMQKDGVDYLYNELGKDLKNLTLLKYYLNEAIENTTSNSKEEIELEVLLQISSDSLYSKKLELFFSSCTEVQQRLIEKLFKQITVTEEGSRLRKPIRVDHFLKVTGSQLQELSPLLQSIQHSFHFLLDVLLPFQERLEVKNHSLISEASVIDVKNEQFIPHWPRLVEWIKEEKESQDLYKRLSEKSILFDKGLTDYLKPPDLDLALSWYEQQKPDELWSNQFHSNHDRTIAYLLTSKVKFQDEISKKELDQKNKIKALYKWASIIGVFLLLVALGFLTLYFDAQNQKTLAQREREIAEKETEKAKKEKIRADAAREDAIQATDEALQNEQLAKIEKVRADEAKNKAQEATNYALEQQKVIKKSNDELNLKEKELKLNVANLVVADSLKAIATKQAQNARNYQETLNAVLILRNQVQKKDYQADELQKLLKEVDLVYSNYKKATLEFKEANLPNNDLYQVMLDIRKKLLDQGTIKGITTDLYSMKSGLRKIRVSSSGTIAAGGDDGELLYSKQALGQGPVVLTKSVPFRGDRIRSLDFFNDKELIIGTVNGKLHQFNTATGVNKPLEVGLVPNQIVEQVVAASKVAFLLVGGEIMKVVPSDLSKTTKVANLSAKNIFKFNEEKLLVVSKDNTLILLDVASLQWQPLATDLKKNLITAAFSSGGNLFLGMEDGQIAICKTLKLGNVISVKTDLIFQPHRTRITSLAFDASSNKLFSASLDQTANIFDLNLKKVNPDYIGIHNYKIEGFDKWIWDFALVQTGKVKTLLTVDESGELKSWQTGAEVLYEEIFSSKNN